MTTPTCRLGVGGWGESEQRARVRVYWGDVQVCERVGGWVLGLRELDLATTQILNTEGTRPPSPGVLMRVVS